LFFLSVSSIESLGRVMIEASEQGVPVITADFGAARDLVHPDYRIPVTYLPGVSGPCDSAFALAQLDISQWQPPARLAAPDCFEQSVAEYRAEGHTAADLLYTGHAQPAAQIRPVTFSFGCDVDGLSLAQRLLADPALLQEAPDHQLLDLGGTLQQYLLATGYNPQVSFTPELPTLV